MNADLLPESLSSAPAYSLPGILHHLQTEWRRFERERNEWQIEKAELSSKIALLEGERRGLENIKVDLLRRNKMLEYALKQERVKHSQGQSYITVSPTRSDSTPLSIRDKFDKEKSLTYSKAKMGSLRSREILRCYLQEVNALTSKNNIMRTTTSTFQKYPTGLTDTSLRQLSTKQPTVNIQRRASLPAHMIELSSSLLSPSSTTTTPSSMTTNSLPKEQKLTLVDNKLTNTLTSTHMNDSTSLKSLDSIESIILPFKVSKSPGVDPVNVQNRDMFYEKSLYVNGNPNEDRFTVPVDRMSKMLKSWEKETTTAKKKSKKTIRDDSHFETANMINKTTLDAELATLSIGDVVPEIDTVSEIRRSGDLKLWKPKFTLRSHYDTVRAVTTHPTESLIVSASEDGTVKLWNLTDALSTRSKRHLGHDIEAVTTFRGHSGPVTQVLVDTNRTWGTSDRIFSCSTDASILVWKLDVSRSDPYSAHDPKNKLAMFVAHSDVVWDMKLHPHKPFLASASADGTVKLWCTDLKSSPLRQTIGNPYRSASFAGKHPNPTSLDFVQTDLKRIIVSYQNAALKIYDIETAQEIVNLTDDITDALDTSFSKQINKVISHQTMSLVITAHEDRQIRFYDTNSGKCVHTMVAHLDAVSTLDINPSGLTLVSGGHDCSVRFWDIGSKGCLQEFTAHRRKHDEGIWTVRYHPVLPLMISGGADSVVKVYT